MTSPTKQTRPPGLVRLEWSTAVAALLGGFAITVVGVGYGLTNVTGVGAGFFPTVAGVLVAVSGGMWLAQLAVARRLEARIDAGSTFEDVAQRFANPDEIVEDGGDRGESEFPDAKGWARVGIIVAAVLGAALVLPVIGYTLSMTLMLAVVLFFVSKRPWWLALVIGIGAAFASRLVFESWLGTELPVSSIDFISTLGL